MMASPEQHNCTNPKWRFCSLEAGICKNCDRCYLEVGDIIEAKCHICNVEKRCKIDYIIDKKVRATCKHCNSAQVATQDLSHEFITCTDERFHNILEQVLDLPRDDLRIVLTALHRRVER